MTRQIIIDAPAKINLGLEILGKRVDGFHEIRSILVMVGLFDTLKFRTGSSSKSQVAFKPGNIALDPIDNLIVRAIDVFNQAAGTDVQLDVIVQKRIPIAAGLGGASSDSAATLLALNAFNNQLLDHEKLREIAAGLGSDVPFFLEGPAAVVSGRGTELRSIRAPSGAVLIVSPNIVIPRKTKTLYGTLRQSDFSGGSATDRQVETIETSGEIDPALLGNGFERALRDTVPESATIDVSMRKAGIELHWLSGAGPSRYAIFDKLDESRKAAMRLREVMPASTGIFPAEFLSDTLAPRT